MASGIKPPKSILKKVSQFDCNFSLGKHRARKKAVKLIRFSVEENEPRFVDKHKKSIITTRTPEKKKKFEVKEKEIDMKKSENGDFMGDIKENMKNVGSSDLNDVDLIVQGLNEMIWSEVKNADFNLQKLETSEFQSAGTRKNKKESHGNCIQEIVKEEEEAKKISRKRRRRDKKRMSDVVE